MTYSGRFTHITGHPSAAGWVQDRESSPVKDRRSTNCATQPTIITCSSTAKYNGDTFLHFDMIKECDSSKTGIKLYGSDAVENLTLTTYFVH